MDNVAENGYDTTKFNQFLKAKFGSKFINSNSSECRIKFEYWGSKLWLGDWCSKRVQRE
jgi:hypothetical protein